MNIGETLPSFELVDEKGQLFTSVSLVGNPLVIYFYPKDETAGCTAQACSFRDSYTAFDELNAKVIGISADHSAQHARFKEKHHLPFTLLADTDNKVRRLFGLKNDVFGLLPGRETFVFDADGKLIHKFNSQFQVSRHVKESLQALAKSLKP
ncbi:MAG: peroxiredoxin [Bacteroidetes bacterium]|jgi:peroxiredoxin Q/BCP|nr:peroxiredoxin [Bacteroidota bacterium]